MFYVLKHSLNFEYIHESVTLLNVAKSHDFKATFNPLYHPNSIIRRACVGGSVPAVAIGYAMI